MADKTPKKSALIAAIGARMNEVPGDVERLMAARGLGIDAAQVPIFDTIGELQIWVFSLQGLMGSEAHFRELAERVAPKASRAKVEAPRPGPTPGAMMAAKETSTSEAAVWFDNLNQTNSDQDLM